jgi:hypothetical protein
MPTTTNFGWTTPADTDLVKDGAAAIRTVAGNIDTSLLDLKGGTTGQYLAKNSNTDLDYVWSTLPAGGGLTLISETVASAVSSIQFASLGSYKQLMLMWSGVQHSTTGSSFHLRFNNDGGSNYLVNSHGRLNTTNTDADKRALTFAGGYHFGTNCPAFGYQSSGAGVEKSSFGRLVLDNYTSTTKLKTWELHYGFWEEANSQAISVSTLGTYNSTSAITTLDIVRVGGAATISNITNTTIRLYGVN